MSSPSTSLTTPLHGLLQQIKEGFYQGTEPKKILIIDDAPNLDVVLAGFPSIGLNEHTIQFRRLIPASVGNTIIDSVGNATTDSPRVFVSNYQGSNVCTGMALEKVLGHVNFVLCEIVHHRFPQ